MYYVRTRQSFGHEVINKFQRFAYLQTQNQDIQLHNVSMSSGIQQNSEAYFHEFPSNSIIQTSSAKIQVGENSDRSLRRFLPILKRGAVLTIRIASASPYTARYSLLVHQFWAKIYTFMYQLYNLFWLCVSLSSCGAVFMLNQLIWITTERRTMCNFFQLWNYLQEGNVTGDVAHCNRILHPIGYTAPNHLYVFGTFQHYHVHFWGKSQNLDHSWFKLISGPMFDIKAKLSGYPSKFLRLNLRFFDSW